MKRKTICIFLKYNSTHVLIIRMEKEGKRTPTSTLVMSQIGQLSAQWRKIENMSQSEIQVQFALLSLCVNVYIRKMWRLVSSVSPAGQWSFSLPLSELYSLRRARFSLGRNFLVLTSRGGHPLPPLHFHRGGTRELFRALQRYIILDQ